MKRFLMAFGIVMGLSLGAVPVSAISEEQANAIHDRCDSIRSSLKSVQRVDSRTRVYLGGYYETILSDFVIPLNVRLVENSLAEVALTENQNNFATTKKAFNDDYISYQQGLEELVLMDCKTEMDKFYNKLEKVRQKRKIVEQDALRMGSLISEHVKLANRLKGKL